MSNRVQSLRTSTPGAAPIAGSFLPGEMWVNFPDLQMGVIDTTNTPQKLIPVRYFSAAANYVSGDFVVQGGKIYFAKSSVPAGAFNASQWTQLAAASDLGTCIIASAPPAGVNGTMWWDNIGGQLYVYYIDANSSQWVPAVNQGMGGAWLALSGGTMAGDLILNRDPQVPLGAATKNYVDDVIAGDNRIINGDMRIDQRNNGVSGTATGYTVDRWSYGATQASRELGARNIGSGPLTAGFGYYLSVRFIGAYTPAAADNFYLQQAIEGDMVSDFAWGTPGAQPVTLSFWAFSSLTGTFGGAIDNDAGTRAYAFSFTIPVASTWTKIAVTIPGDTAGTWVMSGNAKAGSGWRFDLGSGSNFRGPAGAWASTNYNGVTGSVSIVGTNGATFNVTGVKLEIGSVATPYNRQSLTKSMADCQRYYQIRAATRSLAGNSLETALVITEVASLRYR